MNASSSPEGDVATAADNTAADQRSAGQGSDGPTASRGEVVAIAFSRANVVRVESTRASNLADAQTEVDVAEAAAAEARRDIQVVLGVGCAVLVGTLAWVATFPLSL